MFEVNSKRNFVNKMGTNGKKAGIKQNCSIVVCHSPIRKICPAKGENNAMYVNNIINMPACYEAIHVIKEGQ